MQLVKCLAERAAVTQVSAGHNDPVWHGPLQCLEHTKHDRLLTFKTKWVNAVDQVNAELSADLLHAFHRIVEIACDLDRERTVVERLRKLAVRDLARSDEDD